MKIAIINGPNLNLIGTRETEIYGKQNFDTFFKSIKMKYPSIDFSYYQSNLEGDLINELQRVGYEFHGIIFNPGGYSHTSVALGDTIASISAKVIEVHISNIFAREDFRKLSYVSAQAKGIICGMGLRGYELALQYFIE